MLARFYRRGNADRNAIVRDVTQNNRVGAYQHIVADRDRPKKLGARSDVHIVADDRRALVFHAAQANDDSIPDAAIVPDSRITADNDASEMVNNEVVSNFHFAWKIDAG